MNQTNQVYLFGRGWRATTATSHRGGIQAMWSSLHVPSPLAFPLFPFALGPIALLPRRARHNPGRFVTRDVVVVLAGGIHGAPVAKASIRRSYFLFITLMNLLHGSRRLRMM